MKNFRKCETCGSHGHGGRACPVYRLNQQQERRRAQRRRDLSFGLTPELEREIILIRKAWKIAAALGSLLLCATSLFAGTITGRLQTATGGAVTNGTLSFRLSQPAVLVGSASLVTSPASCYISAAGNIVGVPDPLVAPVVTSNTISGTLPAGTYFVVVTYAGASGESVASPESTVVLSAQGTLIVAAPVKQPGNATGYNVYIGTSSGTETLQATITGFTQYSQTSALASGSGLPASNSSVCSLAFSDQLIPSGTYYAVNLVNKNGSTIAGFPQTWCTYGGQSGTINVSNGAPTGNCGTNGVFYPTPILANPQNNAPQSISSPLTLQGTVLAASNFTALAGQNSFNAFSFNSILFVDGGRYAQTGAGLSQAISDCIALPSCPMVVAPNVSGPVSATITVSRSITISLCQSSLTLNGNPGINMSAIGASIQGCGQNESVLTSGGTGDLIQINADKVRIYDVDLEGNNLASIAIHAVAGNFQKISGVFANGSSVAELQFEPTIGVNASIQTSTFESNLSATPSIVINGNDGCGGGTAIPRHFTNIDTGSNPIDIKGGSTVMLSNSSFGGITMTSASCKLNMSGNRELTNPITFLGTNHTVVGNTIAGAITLDASLNNSVIGPNVSVGALVNNAAVTQNNTVLDNNTGNSYTMLPQLTIKNLFLSNTAPTIAGAGCGGSAASISTSNGSAAFDVNVGTAPTSGGCTVTMPAATTRWNCSVNDYTTISTGVFFQKQTSSTTTSIVLQNYSDVAVATAPTASDIYHVTCGGE